MPRKLPGTLLTSAMLKRAGCCMHMRRKFRKRWPNGVRVTSAACEKYARSFSINNWEWAAKNLLNESGAIEFARIQQELKKAVRQNAVYVPVYKDQQFGMTQNAYRVALASIFGDLFTEEHYRSLATF